MISIQQNLTELDKAHRLHATVLGCYQEAIRNMATYAVDLDSSITAPLRGHLSELARELAEASPDALSESRSTLRALLRDYHDRADQYLAGLRGQLNSTAQALQEMVESLTHCDTNHNDKMRGALNRLRDIANSSAGIEVGLPLRALADSMEQSLEQIRKDHQFTISQLQTELRLLHTRIDSLEQAAVTDEVSKLSNQRFLTEYLGVVPAEGACLLVLRMSGLAEARARFGVTIADSVVATFGRRLRNTVPKEAVIGRWSEQDFLAIVPAAAKPATGNLIQRFAEHLSMPYACMIAGKVVRVPIEVAAECLSFPTGTTAEQIRTQVIEAFQ